MKVVESFEIARGLVVAVDEPSSLPVGKRLKALVTLADGAILRAPAYKEWLLRRNLEKLESEAYLLHGLTKSDVPLGSNVEFEIEPNPMGKAHSSVVAEAFKELGWTLVQEFRTADAGEPYEYLFEWRRDGDPIYPQR